MALVPVLHFEVVKNSKHKLDRTYAYLRLGVHYTYVKKEKKIEDNR